MLLCSGSADEFSTSTSSLWHRLKFVRSSTVWCQQTSTQSVRPFVQNSSCEAGYWEEYSWRMCSYLWNSMLAWAETVQLAGRIDMGIDAQTRLKLNSRQDSTKYFRKSIACQRIINPTGSISRYREWEINIRTTDLMERSAQSWRGEHHHLTAWHSVGVTDDG